MGDVLFAVSYNINFVGTNFDYWTLTIIELTTRNLNLFRVQNT